MNSSVGPELPGCEAGALFANRRGMYLIELLMPAGEGEKLRRMRDELTDRFGGVTVFSRSPAVGLWKESDSSPPERDDIIVFEVMTPNLERDWWRGYRETLETRFGEDLIVVRVGEVETL